MGAPAAPCCSSWTRVPTGKGPMLPRSTALPALAPWTATHSAVLSVPSGRAWAPSCTVWCATAPFTTVWM
jgi:hypothetical protein